MWVYMLTWIAIWCRTASFREVTSIYNRKLDFGSVGAPIQNMWGSTIQFTVGYWGESGYEVWHNMVKMSFCYWIVCSFEENPCISLIKEAHLHISLSFKFAQKAPARTFRTMYHTCDTIEIWINYIFVSCFWCGHVVPKPHPAVAREVQNICSRGHHNLIWCSIDFIFCVHNTIACI